MSADAEEVVDRFIAAATLGAQRVALDRHPRLLSDDVASLLEQRIQAAAPAEALVLRERIALLRRCLEIGVPATFAGLILGLPPAAAIEYLAVGLTKLMQVSGLEDAVRCVREHPELLGDAAVWIIDPVRNPDDTDPATTAMRLAACATLLFFRELGLARLTPDVIEIVDALERICDAPGWDARKRFLLERPILLRPEVDVVFAAFCKVLVPDDTRAAFKSFQKLLTRCREIGVEAAFNEHEEHSDETRSQRFFDAVISLARLTTLAEVRQHIGDYPELLGDGSHPDAGMPGVDASEVMRIVDIAFRLIRERVAEVGGRDLDLLDRNIALVNKCRAVGVEQALNEGGVHHDSAWSCDSVAHSILSLVREVMAGRLTFESAVRRAADEGTVRALREGHIGEIADLCLSNRPQSRQSLLTVDLLNALAPQAGLPAADLAAAKYRLSVALAPLCREKLHERELRNRSVALGTEALELLADASLPIPGALAAGFGVLLLEYFNMSGDAAQIDQGIALFEHACSGDDVTPGRLNSLGGALITRFTRFHRLEDMERAVAILRRAMDLCEDPEDRFRISCSLGTSLRHRAARGHEADLAEAQVLYTELAAQVPPRSIDAGSVLNNLALVLRDRYVLNGDPRLIDLAIEKLEESVACAEEGSWSQLLRQGNLAEVKQVRFAHTHVVADLDSSIELYRHVLKTADTSYSDYVKWQRELALDLVFRFDEIRERADLDETIALYESLEQTHVARGDVIGLRGYSLALERRFNLDRRLADLDRAVSNTARIVEASPAGSMIWIQALSLHATMLELRCRETGGTEHHEECIATRKKILTVVTPTSAPKLCASTASHLLASLLKDPHWPTIYEVAKTATLALEELRRQHVIAARPGDRLLGRELAAPYTALTEACIHTAADNPERLREALVYAEAGKARYFLEQMSTVNLQPPASVPQDLITQETDVTRQLRAIDRSLGSERLENKAGVMRARELMLARLDDIRRQIAAFPGTEDYVAARQGTAPTWEDIRDLAESLGPRAALVEFAILSSGQLVAFVLRSGRDSPEIVRLRINADTLRTRFLESFVPDIEDGPEGSVPSDWCELGEILLAPLEPLLSGVDLAYMVPHHLLHFIPLHALNVRGEPFIARRAVVYAPSVGVLSRVLRSERSRSLVGSHSLVMAYTEDKDPQMVESFYGEARDVAASLGAACIIGELASSDTVRRHAQTASVIHLSCHGTFESEDPLSSAVLLADGPLTARDWMGLHMRSDLVVLAACETGINDVGVGDALTGMMSALLYAGASSVLLTLWKVHSLSTREWMTKFYESIRASPGASGSVSFAKAFQIATLHTREQFPDVYQWAPFVLVGDWT